jgi:hypothetical protein
MGFRATSTGIITSLIPISLALLGFAPLQSASAQSAVLQCMQELISNGISEANAAIACSQQQGSVAWKDTECVDRFMYRELRGRLSSDVGGYRYSVPSEVSYDALTAAGMSKDDAFGWFAATPTVRVEVMSAQKAAALCQ